MDMSKAVRRQRIVWIILGLVLVIAVYLGLAEFFANRLPAEYTVLRGVLTTDISIEKNSKTATMTVLSGGEERHIQFRTNVRAYHWDETPMSLEDLTAGKEIEVFVDPYDTAVPPAVYEGCYRIIVRDGPVPSGVPV